MNTITPASLFSTPPDVAYFCMEFALRDDFHIYSGGLGVLAGDYLLEANAQGWNMVGVGLKYSSSLKQELHDGKITYQPLRTEAETQQLSLLVDEKGEPIEVVIPSKLGPINIRVWVKTMSTSHLLLLDTGFDKNSDLIRQITDQLYSGDKYHRLLQEMVLGIGGVLILQKLGFNCPIHLNEGHAVLGMLPLLAEVKRLQPNLNSVAELLAANPRTVIFTNHTLIPAGNDVFARDLIAEYITDCCQHSQLPMDQVLNLGQVDHQPQFSLTIF